MAASIPTSMRAVVLKEFGENVTDAIANLKVLVGYLMQAGQVPDWLS